MYTVFSHFNFGQSKKYDEDQFRFVGWSKLHISVFAFTSLSFLKDDDIVIYCWKTNIKIKRAYMAKIGCIQCNINSKPLSDSSDDQETCSIMFGMEPIDFDYVTKLKLLLIKCVFSYI